MGFLVTLLLVCSAVQVSTGDDSQNSYNIVFPKTEFVSTDVVAASTPYSYAIMHPTETELKEWNSQYFSEKPAVVTTGASIQSQRETAMSLLEYISYVPSERDQKMCSNCWIWASSGAIEVAHTVQNNVLDRLSIQYVNSRYNNGGNSPFTSADFACEGGTASKFVNFYNTIGQYGGNKITIPWSNANASFQDGNATGGHTLVQADTIGTEPKYALQSLSSSRIETLNQPQGNAIASIKSMIDSGKAVILAFYLPDQDSWNSFKTFFGTGDEEESYYDIDQFAGSSYTSSGGGHAVLVTGYRDDGTMGYWQCLNSWGAPANRPNGVFYINMYMDYSAMYSLGSSSTPVTEWETVDVTYAGTEPTPTPDESVTLTPDFEVSASSGYPPLTVHFTDLSQGSPSSWKWNFGDEGGSIMQNPNHTYIQPGQYSVSLTIGKSGHTAITEQKNAITVKIPYVKISPFPKPDGGFYPIPTDQDNDGRFEDIDGNGWLDFHDPFVLVRELEFALKNEPVLQFDFDRSGFIGYGDIVALQKMV
jgi:PKD repeat protein